MKKFLKCVSVFVLIFAVFFTTKVSAKSVEDMIKAGTIEFDCAPLESEKSRQYWLGIYLGEQEGWSDYSYEMDEKDIYKVTVQKHSNSHPNTNEKITVNVKYNYDPAVKKVVDGLIKDMGTEDLDFDLTDIEAVNFLLNNARYLRANPDSDVDEAGYSMELSLAEFSSDVRKKIKYMNFKLSVGYGDCTALYLNRGGEFTFIYDGVYYGSAEPMYVTVNSANAVFVPASVDLTDDAAVIKAVKERLSKYFDIDDVSIEKYVDENLTVENYMIDYFKSVYNNMEQSRKQYFIDQGFDTAEKFANSEVQGMELDNPSIYPYVLVVTFKSGEEIRIAVQKNDEKAKDDRKLVTADASTGVEVAADGVVPLDTLIKVARITSGDEYDKIVKILNNTNVDMFDLKLFTKSNESITKLENGKFRVKLPIKEEFKGKNLKVYFVGTDDKVEEYIVTLSDDGNYAIFETDHFSIYTLAAEGKNPKTGDSILAFVAMFVISTLFLIRIKKYN